MSQFTSSLKRFSTNLSTWASKATSTKEPEQPSLFLSKNTTIGKNVEQMSFQDYSDLRSVEKSTVLKQISDNKLCVKGFTVVNGNWDSNCHKDSKGVEVVCRQWTAFDLVDGAQNWNKLAHEIIGLFAYWITGKI